MRREDLERELTTLGDVVEWPPTPDAAGAIRDRLAPRRPTPWRRMLAVVLVLLAGAAAVPDVRAAVGRLLGFAGGERIERTEEVPRNAPRLDLGRPVTLAEARRRAGFHVGVPSGAGTPDVRLGGALGDRTVSLLLGPDAILSQRPGQAAIFAAKQVMDRVEVRFVKVAGADGVWIGRGPRSVITMRPDGTEATWSAALPGAGVLLWDREGVALRLEIRGDLAEAMRIAESVR
jgi:hypothetical protein